MYRARIFWHILGFPSCERVIIEGSAHSFAYFFPSAPTSSCKGNLLSNARNEYKWARIYSCIAITSLFKWAVF